MLEWKPDEGRRYIYIAHGAGVATGCESDRVHHWPGLVAYDLRDRR